MNLIERSLFSIPKLESMVCVMQWNTLSDQLAYNFPAVEGKYLKWSYRKQLILQEIKRVSADIVCLQEVDHFEDFFQPALNEIGYKGVFHKKKGWHADGCCVFYREKFLKLEDYLLVLCGNQVAVGVLLKHKGLTLYAFSTHLRAGIEHEHIRTVQAKELLDYLSKLNRHPLILCGDFNASPTSSTYMTMRKNAIGLGSIYENRHEPSFTTITYRRNLLKKTDDYIWQRGMLVKDILTFPSEEAIGAKGLPSINYPSDHLSLSAILSIA